MSNKRVRIPGSLFFNVAGIGISISLDEIFQYGRAAVAFVTRQPMPPMPRANEEADNQEPLLVSEKSD